MARFSFYDVFVAVLSLVTYVADVVTDIWLIVYFFTNGYPVWGSLTLGFITMATLVMEIFSFHWHVTDKTITPKIFLIHILFLAPIYRYIRVIRTGVKSRQSGKQHDIDQAFRELNDVCILRLIETFLESAPQLVLQLYIILSDFSNVGYVVVVSSLFSLLSLAWAVTAYTDALHLAYKKLYKRTTTSLITHLLWQTGMISSRVLAIVLFAVAFNGFVAIPLVLHCVIMTLWVILLRPEFGTTACERGLFIAVSSLIHLFCFLNLKDNQSRWRMSFFYGVTLVENTVFVALWYFFKSSNSPTWLDVVAFVVVFGGFALGAGCMLLYYGCCHPSGPAPIPPVKPEFHLPPPQLDHKLEDLKKQKPLVFDVSSTSARINQWLNASLDLSKEGLVENPNDHLNGPTPDTRNEEAYSQAGEPRFLSIRTSPDGNDSAVFLCTNNVTRPFSDSGVHIISPSSGVIEQSSRSHLYTVEDRSSYMPDRSSAQQQREQVMSDQSLVEMFSRCKLDPSFVSNGSLNDSGMFQSKIGDMTYQSRHEDSTGTSGYRTAGSLTSPGCVSMNNTYSEQRSLTQTAPQRTAGSGQSLYSHCDYVNVSGDQNVSDLRPAKISPLDPSKLWAEFNARLNYGSDTAINRSVGNSSIKVVPDHLRGITSLSLSYSCLSDPDYTSDTNRFHSLPDSTGLSETASSFLYKKKPNRTRNSAGSSLNNSQGVSFSNLSLQLPDSSNNSRNRYRMQNQSTNNGGSYGDIQQTEFCERGRKLGDSLQTDRQSSYSSDQGLSSTERGLSSSSSAAERSQRSFTSSGFQSEESNFSDQSPLYPPGFRHNHYHQSTPIVENEISTIFSLPSTIRTKKVSLDAEVFPPGQAALDTTPHIGCDKGKSAAVMVPTSSLFSSNPADSSDPLAHAGNSSTSSLEESSCVQSAPFVENEISTISSLPSTVRTKRVSLDQDLCPPSYASLDPARKCSDSRHTMADAPPTTSLLTSDDACILPPLTVRSRSTSSDGSSHTGRFFKNPLTEDTGSPEDLSDEDSTRYPGSDGSVQNERSSISAMISNLSSSCVGTSTLDSISIDSSITPHNRPMQGKVISRESTHREPPVYVNVDECSPKGQTCGTQVWPVGEHSSTVGEHVIANTPSNSLSKSSSRSEDLDRLKYLSSDPTEQSKLMELLAEMSGSAGDQMNLPSTSDTGDYVNVENFKSPQEVKDMEDSPYRLGRSIDKFNRERWRASLDKESRDQLVRDIENMAPRKLYKLKSKAAEPKKKLSPMKISDYTNSPYKFRQPGQKLDYENLKNVSPASLGSAFEDVKAMTPSLYTDYVNVYDLSGERTGQCPMATPESLSDAVVLDDHTDTSGRFDKTFNVPLEAVRGEIDIDSLSQRSSELSRTKSPINTSGINSAFKPVKSRNSSYSRDSSSSSSPGVESNSNLSGVSGNRSSVSSDRSSMSDCGQFKKPRPYTSQFSGCTEDSSSFGWSRRSDLDSVSEAADTTYQKLNYLEMVGKDPLSFSTSKFLADETSSVLTKHSYSDSIPWEDSVNRSTDYQTPSDPSFCKSSARKPLQGLENTPVISPIYGGQSVKTADELSCRKRYMSTPKLSSNSVMSLSDTSSDSRSTSKLTTPHRRDLRNKTFNNTSTWSSQSDQSDSPRNNGLYESCFSSLSKTTYI